MVIDSEKCDGDFFLIPGYLGADSQGEGKSKRAKKNRQGNFSADFSSDFLRPFPLSPSPGLSEDNFLSVYMNKIIFVEDLQHDLLTFEKLFSLFSIGKSRVARLG